MLIMIALWTPNTSGLALQLLAMSMRQRSDRHIAVPVPAMEMLTTLRLCMFLMPSWDWMLTNDTTHGHVPMSS